MTMMLNNTRARNDAWLLVNRQYSTAHTSAATNAIVKQATTSNDPMFRGKTLFSENKLIKLAKAYAPSDIKPNP